MSKGPSYDIVWGNAITLSMLADGGVALDLNQVPEGPGVYIFLRQHSSKCDALYVGQSLTLRNRIRLQLNNLKLMKEIRNSRTGTRLLVVGRFVPKQGQQLKPSLKKIESAFIRHFVAHNDALLNKQGTSIKLATVQSDRKILKNFLPKTVSVETK